MHIPPLSGILHLSSAVNYTKGIYLKVIIVDDEHCMVEILSEYIGGLGYEVDTAHNGRNGLKLLKQNIYDVAFMDINMPELSGLELNRYIKSNNFKTKTVIVTGYTSIDTQFAKLSGVDDFINKPVKLAEVSDILKKYS